MKIIRSKLKYKPSKGEVIKGPSKTVPDDSYTIQELLRRHEAGLGFGIQRLGQFDLEDDDEHDALDMNQYQQLDITDREVLHAEMSEIRETAKKASKRPKKEETKENPET